MKIYKVTEASEYLGVSINTLKTLANNTTESPYSDFLIENDESYHRVKIIQSRLILG